MATRFLKFSWLIVALLFTAIARAHDPLSSWAALRPEANGLHFVFSLTESEAIVYLKNVEPSANLRPDAPFEKLQPWLLKHAAEIFEFRARDALLTPVESQVVITEEQTIEVRLVLAWPEGDSLQIRAKFLQYVSPDHTTYLNVLDHDEHLIAGAMPTVDDPVIVSPMPPRPGGKERLPPAAKSSPDEKKRQP